MKHRKWQGFRGLRAFFFLFLCQVPQNLGAGSKKKVVSLCGQLLMDNDLNGTVSQYLPLAVLKGHNLPRVAKGSKIVGCQG